MPRITAPMTHPGIPKKNLTNGILGDEEQEHAQLDGTDPVLLAIHQRKRNDGRDHGHQTDEHGEADPAEEPLDLRAEVPEHGEHDHQPDVRWVRDRPGRNPPDLAVEHEFGDQGQLAEDVVVRYLPAPTRTCWRRT